MPDVKEVLSQCKWLIEKGRGGEPAKLLLPRIEAKRRIANKEKRHRVTFECDEVTYSLFHEQLKRYREQAGNVTVAHSLMVKVLAGIRDELIQEWSQS